MPTIRRARYTIITPDIQAIVRGIIRDYMPEAGKLIKDRAVAKLGIYQAGWAPLAASTLSRKRRRKLKSGERLKFRRIKRRPMPGIGDTPLVEFGPMAKSVWNKQHGGGKPGHYQTSISADFPAQVHEQDPEMELIRKGGHTPPKRPFLGPAMNEMLPKIVRDLESIVGSRL